MRESTRQRIAFELYVGLGAGRSLAKLHEAIANGSQQNGLKRVPGMRTLYRWSAELDWQDQLADLEREARRRAQEASVQQLVEMNQQLREGKVNAADLGNEFAKSIPILGGFVSGFENLRELIETIQSVCFIWRPRLFGM